MSRSARRGATPSRGPVTWPWRVSRPGARGLAGTRRRRQIPDHRGFLHRGALSTYLLKLYVTGQTPRARIAIENLERLCRDELAGEYELQIIDVLEHPELAEDDRVLATPTLIKQLPPPLRRVIGDLSDKEKVLFGLDVQRKGDA